MTRLAEDCSGCAPAKLTLVSIGCYPMPSAAYQRDDRDGRMQRAGRAAQVNSFGSQNRSENSAASTQIRYMPERRFDFADPSSAQVIHSRVLQP